MGIVISILKKSLGRDFYLCFTERDLYFGKLNKDSFLDLSKAEFCELTSNKRVGIKNTFPKVISIPYFMINEVHYYINKRDLVIFTESRKVRVSIKSKDEDLILKLQEEFYSKLGYKFKSIDN